MSYLYSSPNMLVQKGNCQHHTVILLHTQRVDHNHPPLDGIENFHCNWTNQCYRNPADIDWSLCCTLGSSNQNHCSMIDNNNPFQLVHFHNCHCHTEVSRYIHYHHHNLPPHQYIVILDHTWTNQLSPSSNDIENFHHCILYLCNRSHYCMVVYNSFAMCYLHNSVFRKLVILHIESQIHSLPHLLHI